MQEFSAACGHIIRCMEIGDRSFLAGFLEGEASLSVREQNGGQWRYEGDVNAPSQGTVYRLFPGGWAEVLDASVAA